MIDVCSYKFIRSVELKDLVKLAENKEPFNSEVVHSIDSYLQIFMYLHSHIGKMHLIVPNKYIDTWYDQLYEIIYNGYNSYLFASTQRALKYMKDYSNIPLFSNIKHSTKLASYDFDMEYVIQEQEKLYSTEYNKLNVFFSCHPYFRILRNIRHVFILPTAFFDNVFLYAANLYWKFIILWLTVKRTLKRHTLLLTLINFS